MDSGGFCSGGSDIGSDSGCTSEGGGVGSGSVCNNSGNLAELVVTGSGSCSGRGNDNGGSAKSKVVFVLIWW